MSDHIIDIESDIDIEMGYRSDELKSNDGLKFNDLWFLVWKVSDKIQNTFLLKKIPEIIGQYEKKSLEEKYLNTEILPETKYNKKVLLPVSVETKVNTIIMNTYHTLNFYTERVTLKDLIYKIYDFYSKKHDTFEFQYKFGLGKKRVEALGKRILFGGIIKNNQGLYEVILTEKESDIIEGPPNLNENGDFYDVGNNHYIDWDVKKDSNDAKITGPNNSIFDIPENILFHSILPETKYTKRVLVPKHSEISIDVTNLDTFNMIIFDTNPVSFKDFLDKVHEHYTERILDETKTKYEITNKVYFEMLSGKTKYKGLKRETHGNYELKLY